MKLQSKTQSPQLSKFIPYFCKFGAAKAADYVDGSIFDTIYKYMKDETKKKITKWFWILFMAPFALLTLLLLAVWAFADIPSFR